MGTWSFIREVLAQSFLQEVVSLVSFPLGFGTWVEGAALGDPSWRDGPLHQGALTSFRWLLVGGRRPWDTFTLSRVTWSKERLSSTFTFNGGRGGKQKRKRVITFSRYLHNVVTVTHEMLKHFTSSLYLRAQLQPACKALHVCDGYLRSQRFAMAKLIST